MFFTYLNPKISFFCNRKQGTFLKKWRASSLARGIKKFKLYYYYYYYFKKISCANYVIVKFLFHNESLTGFNLIYDKNAAQF